MAQNRIADYLTNYRVRLIDDLDVPALTATVEGTAQTTRYEYSATFKTIVGETTPCDTVVVTTGNATLNGFNKILLNPGNIPPLATHVRFWKNFFTYTTSTVRLNSTAYNEGDYVVLAANSIYRYECTTAGTTASSVGTGWTETIGGTKTDGGVTWTCRSNQTNDWKLLTEVTAAVGQYYDTGASGTAATVPVANTSGRPGVIAIMPKPATFHQRQSWSDLMSLVSDMVQDLGDTLHRDGDIKEGCVEYNISGNTWGFTSGVVYFLGRFIDVPAGQIELTGSGTEKVGLTITPVYSTPNDDLVQRCADDEGCLPIYSNTGPDWLYFELTWVKDTDGQIDIKEFIDGVPKTATIVVERSELEKSLALRTYATSGSFVVENFPLKVIDHESDETQLTLTVGPGFAFPMGFPVRTVGTRTIDFDKARTVKAVNNSGVDVFDLPGAVNEWNYWTADTVVALNTIVVPTILNGYRYKCTAVAGDEESGSTEPTWSETPGATVVDNDIEWTVLDDDYDLNGLALTVQVGNGGEHTLTFAADDLTAAQVVTAIEAEFNAYPTAGEDDLVDGTASEAILQLRAANGKSLTVSGTALAQLGWAAGTTTSEGQRIYQINDAFVKTVTDMNYKTESVAAITHNGTTHKDLLGTSVVSIIGASATLADCHDGKFDYLLNTDFVKDGNYISFEGLGGSEPGSGATYFVKFQYNYNAVKGSRHLCRVVDAKVVKSGEDLPDNLTFTDATSITRVSTGANVTPTGTPKDVVRILRINNSPGQSTDQYTAYSLAKNSGALSHDTSYIDWSEAGTPGTTGGGQPANSSIYYVTYEFWHHAVEGDYVAADSYDDYPEIEMAPNGTWYLRDCIDFRTDGGTWPIDGEDPTFDYEFYMGRVDKLTLDDLGNFTLVTGSPASVNPPIPVDQDRTLTIAIVRIRPYTYTSSDAVPVSVEALRITQRGIQNLAERIERLEYWNTVNSLEKEITALAASTEVPGLYTDALTGYGRADLQFNKNGVYFSSALDRYERRLLLPAARDKQVVEVDLPNSTHVRRAGNTIMLDYQPNQIMSQPYAGITVNGASDFVVNNYYGTIALNPSVDAFIDSEQLPAINVDFDDSLTPLLEMYNADQLANHIEWGEWNRTGSVLGVSETDGEEFFGTTVQHFQTATAWETTRTGVYQTLVPGGTTVDLGARVVDMTIQGMMRTTDSNGDPFVIQLDIRGMVPNADHACTFYGIPVDLAYDSTPTNAAGQTGTATYSGKTTAKTSNDGCLTATIVVPSGVPVGTAEVKVFYYDDPDISVAQNVFSTVGFMQSNQSTTVGMPGLSTETTTQLGVQVGITGRGWDPLAQTFVPIKSITYISAIELFFSTKPSDGTYTVQIRDTVNGYPGPMVFASVTLMASEVSVSSDGSTGTTFTFDNVIGYTGGTEYCFVGLPGGNSTEWNLFAAEVGTIDIISGQRITTQVHDGALFHSPNNRVWEPWTKRDLKFNIYESNFENDAQIVFSNLTGVEASRLVCQFEQFVCPGTNARWAYSVDGGTEWEAFNPKMEVNLEQIITQVKLRVDITSIGGNYQIIDKYAGILLLYHDATADYIGANNFFTDPLVYPNKVTCSLDLDTDGTNGSGVRSVTPYFSIDDGETWVEIGVKEGFNPVAKSDPYYNYQFETPDEATITGATNASPIVITSTGHGFKDNAIVVIAAVEGNTNANGTWVVTNATDDTFELYATTGIASSGNSEYTTAGTINLSEFTQMRGRIHLETSNRAVTPSVQNVGFITAKV